MSAALAQALRAVLPIGLPVGLPVGLAVGWADPRVPGPAWPGEAIAAVPKRQREFAAGRAAARAAMAELGFEPAAIGIGADRAPVWPLGVTGSISHSDSACLAVVGRAAAWRGIGLDIEPATALAAELWDAVLRPEERAGLDGLQAKLIFTAKEAAYKAQFPQSRTLFGFDGLRVRLGQAEFTATFARAVPPFAAGQSLHGLHFTAAGHLVALVLIAASSL